MRYGGGGVSNLISLAGTMKVLNILYFVDNMLITL